MQEVAKTEIVKLLDTGIIYPIADSPWVSPIHCVPKKGGITVVTNKKDELVPTRTVTEFNLEIKDKKGTENATADHLSQIENNETSEDSDFDDNFPGETLMEIITNDTPWFADFSNYLVQFRRTSLTGLPAQSVRSSNAIALDSPYLLVLITGTSQSGQHVDTSLIHIESYKLPTAELFDVNSGRISIHHCEY
ncbi:hypothetical protein Tco_1532135 [Tanacetum coccineum]